MIVVHTLEWPGRTVRDTSNLIHDPAGRNAGQRNLADASIRDDSANPEDRMSQPVVVMLALFGQMDRTYAIERAAHASAVAVGKGKKPAIPACFEPTKLAHAAHLRDQEPSISEIVKAADITRSGRYRHLPPRPAGVMTGRT